jgi:O-antigen/teichoic acid export membrane protein
MSLTARGVSGVAWSAGAQVIRLLLSFGSVSVLAHLVPPSGYGLMAMAGTVTYIFDNLRDLGTGVALIQRQQITSTLVSSVFWFNQALGCLLTGASYLAAPYAAAFFREPQLIPVLQLIGFNFLAYSATTVPNALLSRQMDFRSLAIAQVLAAILGTAVTLSLAISGYSVWSLVIGGLVTNSATAIGTWILSKWLPGFIFSVSELRRIARFGAALSGFNAVNYLSRNADNIIVGRYLGNGPLGFYQMSYTVMTYPLTVISGMIAQVLSPVFSRLQDDNDRFRSNYCRLSVFVAMVTAPLMLGLFATTKSFVFTLLGPQWGPTIPVLLVFSLLGMMQSVFTLIGQIFTAKGRTDILLWWGLGSSLCYVTAFFAGLPWGIVGVASAYAIVWTALMIPGFWLAFRLIELRLADFFRLLAPVLSCAAIMAVLVSFEQVGLERMGAPVVVQLAVGVATGAVLYIVLLRLLAGTALADVRALLELSGNPLFARAAARWLPQNASSQ